MFLLSFPFVFFILFAKLNLINSEKLFTLRGGKVPHATDDGVDYYEQFPLDYGTQDTLRIAGAMRGLIASGNIANLPEKDPFFKWLNEHLEKGSGSEIQGRLKPFYVII